MLWGVGLFLEEEQRARTRVWLQNLNFTAHGTSQ